MIRGMQIIAQASLLLSAVAFFSCSKDINAHLYSAAAYGETEKVKELLARGADPNYRHKVTSSSFEPYETPIVAAAEGGNLEIVKMLVKAGADIETSNSYSSQTALYNAVQNQHRDVIEYLLALGADANTEDHMGKTVLMMAIIQDDLSLVKLLVKYGAWPDPSDAYADEVAGSVGLTTIQMSEALGRPYTGYLKQVQVECQQILKKRINCKRI